MLGVFLFTPLAVAAPISGEPEFTPTSQMALEAPISASTPTLSRHEENVSLASQIALKNDLNESKFLGTIKCESDFNEKAVGDHGRSFGIAQINLDYNPSVKEEEALDPVFALNWMASEWKAGRASHWSCYRKLYAKRAQVL